MGMRSEYPLINGTEIYVQYLAFFLEACIFYQPHPLCMTSLHLVSLSLYEFSQVLLVYVLSIQCM